MYPATTSLIPAQIALAKYLETYGLGAIQNNYPYWYFGTTPYHYLTGPIIPNLLVLLHKFLPSADLFSLFFGLILVSWLVAGLGLYLLVKNLSTFHQTSLVEGAGNRVAILSAIFFLTGPIVPFLFRFSDGLYLISFAIVIFTLLFYQKFLEKETRKTTALLFTSLLIVILLNTLILSTTILGMISLLLVRGSWKNIEVLVKNTVLLLLAVIGVSTFWYSPGYWLTLLGAPSLAGNGLLGVLGMLGKLLPIVLAFGMATSSVKILKNKSPLHIFTFIWLFVFGFMTLLRFLSDPDFWLDWTSYGMELQLGLGMLGALLIPKILGKFGRLGGLGRLGILGGWGLVFLLIFNRYVIGTLQTDMTQSVEYKIGSKLDQIVRSHSASSGQAGEKVFLSGTTAFWLNAYFDIPQVRGGVDQASTDKDWRRIAWELKEGVNINRAITGLRSKGVAYLVVNDTFSKVYYHDFNFPGAFEKVNSITKIYDENGDYIYRIN